MESVKSGFLPTVFGKQKAVNTQLFSDWDAPEEHDPKARPWSILSAPEGDLCAGHFSVSQVSISNLEFRVRMDRAKMYPTESAVNLQHVSRVNIQDSQFCLDESVRDTLLGKELQHNPCHVAGLIASGDQNDDNVLRNDSEPNARVLSRKISCFRRIRASSLFSQAKKGVGSIVMR